MAALWRAAGLWNRRSVASGVFAIALRSLLATNLDRAYLDDQPVVGGRDACRQTRRELRMRRRVGEVREEGPARTDLLRRRDGLRDREMQRVRARQQGVQHQHLE